MCGLPPRRGDETWSYLHELLLLPLAAADGVPDGAHLAQDGLRVLQLVARRAVRHLLVDPGGQGLGEGRRGNVSVLPPAGAQESTEWSERECMPACSQRREQTLRCVKASAQ